VSPAKPRDPGAGQRDPSATTKGQLRGLSQERVGGGSGTWKALAEIHDTLPKGSAAAVTPPSMAESRPASSAKMPVARQARGPERVRVVTGEAPPERAMITIRARCHDDLLEYTHQFVGSYTRSRFRSGLADGLSVATYELLGNALNYGSVVGDVVFEIVENPRSVAVRVSNETVQVRIDMLCSHLERVGKDPEAAFLEEMRRSTAGGITRPMLGLARVVHEAKLLLEVYVSGTRLTVVASASM
jgi:hypothetical protein